MPAPTPTFADINASNFTAEVVERSKTMPVVVDFWATWCGPCKTLGPMLEDLALETPGRFFLAKVDVDENQELAQMFRVEQVPMVVALREGKLVDGFTGAQPLEFLRDFIDRLAPGAAPDARLAAALELEQSGDTEGAIALLQAALEEDAQDDEVRLALVRNLLDADRIDEATQAFDAFTLDETSSAELTALASRLRLASTGGDLDQLRAKVEASPDDLAARIELGRTLAAKGRSEEGLDELLTAVERDKDFGDQAARKAMLEVFEALGEDDPLVGDFRRRLQMLLF